MSQTFKEIQMNQGLKAELSTERASFESFGLLLLIEELTAKMKHRLEKRTN